MCYGYKDILFGRLREYSSYWNTAVFSDSKTEPYLNTAKLIDRRD
jgi:hypothetical protein